MANMKNIKPLSDYLLIEPLEKETTLPSGIVIPDSAKEKPQEGKVIAVGPGRITDRGGIVKMNVREGNIVMYKKWGGTEIKIEGKEMILIKEEDVLAIVEQ